MNIIRARRSVVCAGNAFVIDHDWCCRLKQWFHPIEISKHLGQSTRLKIRNFVMACWSEGPMNIDGWSFANVSHLRTRTISKGTDCYANYGWPKACFDLSNRL